MSARHGWGVCNTQNHDSYTGGEPRTPTPLPEPTFLHMSCQGFISGYQQ